LTQAPARGHKALFISERLCNHNFLMARHACMTAAAPHFPREPF
jgi:hypothetical protein